jgi:ABC-2 type transport system permease protein
MRMTQISSVIITVCAIILAFAIAVGAAFLPEYDMSFDISVNRIYTIEDVSIEFLDSLNTDIKIYLVGANGMDTVIEYFADRFCQASDNVELEYVSLEDSAFLNKYGIADSATEYTFVVESNKRYTVVNYDDMLLYSNASLGFEQISASDYYYYLNYYEYYYQVMAAQGGDVTEIYNVIYSLYYETEPYFIGEYVLLEACEYVSLEKIPSILFTKGNGEAIVEKSPLGTAFTTFNEIDLSAYSELTVDDASCLVINAPTEDLDREEADIVLNYLKQGGRVVVITNEENLVMPNLCRILSAYGLSSDGGTLFVGEGEEKTSALDVELNYNHEAMAAVAKAGLLPKIYDANAINIFTPSDASFTTSALLVSPDESYLDGNEELGGRAVAVAVEEKIGRDVARLAWFTGASSFNSAELDATTAESNMYTLLYTMAWLNRSYVSNVPTAVPIPYDVEPLSVPSGSTVFAGVMLIAVLPAIVVAFGLITRHKRNSKKA